MKTLFWILAIIFSNSIHAYYFPDAVYGKIDNREEVFMSDPISQELAKSVVAKISSRYFNDIGNSVIITGELLKEKENLCDEVRFENQLSSASCTGFLVGPDIIVTAGHCMRNSDDCDSSNWVFDFIKDISERSIEINKSNIYGCKSHKRAYKTVDGEMHDYAVIKLDRPVQDRIPLKYRKTGNAKKDTPLTIIGSSNGTPLKVAHGGFITNLTRDTLITNLDAFDKNSGSPVINSDTLEVEGILVNGNSDYYLDKKNGCKRVKNYDMNDEHGEIVFKITTIKEIIDLIK